MAMSNAERQRKFRQNRDRNPEKREQYLKQSKDRYKKDRASGKNKPIKEMTEREKRHVRKNWRLQKKKDRERAKKIKSVLENELTPSSSPDRSNSSSARKEKKRKNGSSRERARCYRENKRLTDEVEILKKKTEHVQEKNKSK